MPTYFELTPGGLPSIHEGKNPGFALATIYASYLRTPEYAAPFQFAGVRNKALGFFVMSFRPFADLPPDNPSRKQYDALVKAGCSKFAALAVIAADLAANYPKLERRYAVLNELAAALSFDIVAPARELIKLTRELVDAILDAEGGETPSTETRNEYAEGVIRAVERLLPDESNPDADFPAAIRETLRQVAASMEIPESVVFSDTGQATPTSTDDELEVARAAVTFLAAGRAYRATVKRLKRRDLYGVMWILDDSGEAVLYSENPKYAEQLRNVVFDCESDRFYLPFKNEAGQAPEGSFCPHGNPPEDCDACMRQADEAYDAARERRFDR